MLIFCVSMPRSGGTLLYQLTKEICEQFGIAKGRGFPKERFRNGVVKTEFCEPWMIARVEAGKAIAFGNYRDFRDVILSLRNFYNRREMVKNIAKTWTIEDVLRHRSVILYSYYCWQPYATWFRYEQDNLAQVIIDKVSQSLEVELSTQEKVEIIGKYSKENNLKRMKELTIPMDAGNGSMLTRWHLGQPANWQNDLTPKEVQAIEAIGGEFLIEHGYK